MPELVACPSCGCRVQVSELHLGKRTRCIACGSTFVAEPGPAPSLPEAPDSYPLHPQDKEQHKEESRSLKQRGLPRHRLPLCPGCHRPVGWEVLACPYCGHLFDPLDVKRPLTDARRRDGEMHRGGTIDTLGTVSLLGGVLALCTGPLGVLVALGTGIPAWVMASGDLPQMQSGVVDPEGRIPTEYGRNKAVVGIVLGMLFGLFWLLLLLNRAF